ncbi:MAG: hypothetical protein LUQ25_00730 [Methanoregulaceae archaeon]|nr:hypothetical protein [Methanoregulaceae archaeon]
MTEHMGMHGMGMMHPAQDQLMEKMWERLSDDQVKKLIARKIEAKIMMKEAWVKQLQFKIETYKMVKQMIEKG